MVHRYDALIIGAGGAGLMAALQLSSHGRVAAISKLYPTRSHTGAAQGGIGAALGNHEEDHWEWHMFDTVKGGDYLADQDSVEILCREAIETVYDLEHWGLPFSRTPEGKIAQRPFGGHTREFGKAPVRRSCYAADRTGHMILQTMYQQCLKNQVHFYDEYHVLDLLIEQGRCAGVVAHLPGHRERLHTFHAKAVVFATGGCGRMFSVTSNAHALTGDGMAVVLRRGIPLAGHGVFPVPPHRHLQDGHPAQRGRARRRRHSAEQGRRALHGALCRHACWTWRRATWFRARCTAKCAKGAASNGKNYVHLDMTHLGREVLDLKLPDITEFVRTYLGIEPAKELIPVQPTAHYAMGGIPTDNDGRVVIDEKKTPLPGLYAAGETACVSVHGANRLGTNSLVDILVFGRRSGRHAANFIKENDLAPLGPNPEERGRAMVEGLLRAARERKAPPTSGIRSRTK